jgi:nucleoid-associated protein YgaU
MAKETKIGLLVGMGFIVCFAIILSNRGEVKPGRDQTRFEVTRVVTATPAPVHSALSERRAQTHEQDATPVRQGRRRRHGGVTRGPATVKDSEPEPAYRSVPLDQGQTQGAGGPANSTNTESARFTRRGAPIGALQSPPVVSVTQGARPNPATPLKPGLRSDDGPRQPIESVRPAVELKTPEAVLAAVEAGPAPMAEKAPTEETPSSNSAPSARRGPSPPVKPLDTHEVQPGDNLTRIAQRYYGRSAPDLINAIYEANRATMSSPDNLVVGRTIVLPAIGATGEADRVGRDSPGSPTRLSNAGASSSDRDVTIHKVRPGDTLTRIARAHYGADGRQVIDAIYEANRSTLSSPDRLIIGCRIVLPRLEAQERAVTSDQIAAIRSPAVVRSTSTGATRRPLRSSPRSSREGDHGVEWEWYQLEKGDRYAKVAAEKLGSARRWPELAELNMDIFPDPHRIRDGVSIRIPVDKGLNRSAASARGDRR